MPDAKPKTKGRPRRRGGFGYVQERGPGSFTIRWREGRTQRRQSGFTTRTAATEALARIRVRLSSGVLVEARKAAVSVNHVAREWLKLHSAPNLRSHADNVERYAKHIKPVLGDAPLAAVTPMRVLELRARLQTATFVRKHLEADGTVTERRVKLAPRTINLVLALLRSILRFAVVGGYLPVSPTDKIARGKLMLPLDRPKLAPPLGDAANVGCLLAAILELSEEQHRPSLYPLFATLAYTGVRRGEALGLRWADIDLDRRMMTIRRSYAGLTKSSKHRSVPLPSELVAILKAHKLADPWKAELVFPNDQGEMYSPSAKLEVFLRGALARAGLSRVRIHDLRHQYASTFVMNGGDIFTLQRILGHSTPTLTSDTYAHLAPGHLAGEADRISFPQPAPAAKVLQIGGAS